MSYVYICIAVMAIVTYLIRAVPLTVFRKKIENRYVSSFLYYVPYACLTAMTFPTILYATENIFSALAGLITAVVLALCRQKLFVVAAFACVAVFIVERLPIF